MYSINQACISTRKQVTNLLRRFHFSKIYYTAKSSTDFSIRPNKTKQKYKEYMKLPKHKNFTMYKYIELP